ncbi:MAG: O-antigen ligase family protein [Paludibacteraceae bacterium]|nr:O-antigen ligase family protein [Paludibacteraceae bacterium]
MVKETNYINRQITDFIYPITAFSVPFLNFAPVPVIILSILCIFHSLQSVFLRKKISVNITATLLLLWWIFTLISSFIAELSFSDISRMSFQIRLPLILLPIAFLFKNDNINKKEVLKWFAIGSYATALLIVILYLWTICFGFENLSRNFIHLKRCFYCIIDLISHRTYVCFNLLTALIITYQWLMENRDRKRILFFVFASLCCGTFIFVSEARISLISFCILIFTSLFFLLIKKLNKWQLTIFCTICSAILISFLIFNVRINNLLIGVFNGDANLQSLDPRFQIWSCASKIISDGIPVTGFGTGMAYSHLYNCYLERHFEYGEVFSLGSHNQFLECLMEYGYTGLILLLAALLSILFHKSSQRRFFIIWFIILVINLCFESMMSRSIGSYSIAFLLVLAGNPDNEDVKHEKRMQSVLKFLILSAIVCSIVAYIAKDKTESFNYFQKRFERIENLPGIVPEDLEAKSALKIDKNTPVNRWRDVAVFIFHFDEMELNESDSLHFSLYVYVSNDFEPDFVRIKMEERERNTFLDYYNLEEKGTWQKLTINKSGMKGNVSCIISTDKTPYDSFGKLKGFMLFSEPKIEVKKK